MSYSPTLGRFIQTDPVEYEDGMNLYQAFQGNPVARTDPFGLTAAPPIEIGPDPFPGFPKMPGQMPGGGRSYNTADTIRTSVSVARSVSNTRASLEISAHVSMGEAGTGWELPFTLANTRGSGKFPNFMAVVLEDGRGGFHNNLNPNYPGHLGDRKQDSKGGRPITIWDGMNRIRQKSLSTTVTIEMPDVCKRDSGQARLWFWYSDILEDKERKNLGNVPGLVAGYTIMWNYEPKTSDQPGIFTIVDVDRIEGLPIAGHTDILHRTGIDFYRLVKDKTGYSGFDPRPGHIPIIK